MLSLLLVFDNLHGMIEGRHRTAFEILADRRQPRCRIVRQHNIIEADYGQIFRYAYAHLRQRFMNPMAIKSLAQKTAVISGLSFTYLSAMS